MIIETPFGSLADPDYQSLEVDYLDIEWYNAHKTVDLRTTRAGREIGLRPDSETALRGWRSGDVLFADETCVVAVHIPADECISVTPADTAQLIRLCYEIGNRHAPFFYGECAGEFITPQDEPVFRLLDRLGLNPCHTHSVLSAERRISQSTGHGHAHDDGGYDGHGARTAEGHPHAHTDADEHSHSHSASSKGQFHE